MRWLSFTIIKVCGAGMDGTRKEEQDHWKDWVLMTIRISEVGEGTRAVDRMIGVMKGRYWPEDEIMAPSPFYSRLSSPPCISLQSMVCVFYPLVLLEFPPKSLTPQADL